MSSSIGIFSNLDLLAVSITTAATLILGFSVYFSDRKSITNVTFLLFTLLTAIWSITNYLYYSVGSIPLAFVLIKIVICIGVWHAFTFFQLFYVFPSEKYRFSKIYKYCLVPIAAITSIVNLTPLVFSRIAEVQDGRISKIENGPAIALFGIIITAFIILGIILLIKKILSSQGTVQKQFKEISIGVVLTFSLILIFNFVFPALLNNARFIPLSSVFIFPFIFFTSYSILRHKLFNVKVAAPAILIFALAIVSFLDIIYSKGDVSLILFRSGVFVLILMFGILLLKGVAREISLREQLQVANEGQSNLIHIMNHQIKGYLSKSKNIFAELMTTDYGEIPKEAKPLVQEGFDSLNEGVKFVQGVLNGSSAESGQLVYNMLPLEFGHLVSEVVDNEREHAESKGLKLDLRVDEGEYNITGDIIQLKESVLNLIDNSINYTPSGSISVRLAPYGKKVLLSVKDTGVGIAPEDKPKLFTKGGRGRDSLKINVNSTGYGLAFVKAVIEAHKGRVWVESEGVGKGATFFAELPRA